MKRENIDRLLELFGEIDEKYIEEACEFTAPRKPRVFTMKILPLAACVAVILLGAYGLSRFLRDPLEDPANTGATSATVETEFTTTTEYTTTTTAPADTEPSDTTAGQSETTTATTPPETTETTPEVPIEIEIPAWYAPGELTLRTMTAGRQANALSAPQSGGKYAFLSGGGKYVPLNFESYSVNVEFPFGAEIPLWSCWEAKIFAVPNGTSVPGCEGESGILYNMETGEVTCLSKALAGRVSMPANGYVEAWEYCEENGTFLIMVRGAENNVHDAYLLRYDGLALTALPAYFGEAMVSGGVFGLDVAADLSKAVYVDVVTGDVTYFDFASGTQTVVYTHNMENLTMGICFPQFSPDGKYFIFNVPNAEGATVSGDITTRFALYECATGRQTLHDGRIVRFVGGGLLVETATETYVLDTSTAAKGDPSALKEWEKCDVVTASVGSSLTGYGLKVAVKNLFTDAEETLFDKVSFCEPKNGYIYTYVQGESDVVITDVVTRESFGVPVPRKFLAAAEADGRSRRLSFSISVSSSGRSILLQYFLGEPIDRNTAQAAFDEAYNRFDSSTMASFFAEYTCLADMEDYVKTGFAVPVGGYQDRYEFYSCEDYAYLVVWQGNANNRLQNTVIFIVEDYRDNSFSVYNGGGGTFGIYTDNSSKWLRKELPENIGRAKTAEIYSFLSFREQAVDFAKFFTSSGKTTAAYTSYFIEVVANADYMLFFYRDKDGVGYGNEYLSEASRTAYTGKIAEISKRTKMKNAEFLAKLKEENYYAFTTSVEAFQYRVRDIYYRDIFMVFSDGTGIFQRDSSSWLLNVEECEALRLFLLELYRAG